MHEHCYIDGNTKGDQDSSLTAMTDTHRFVLTYMEIKLAKKSA